MQNSTRVKMRYRFLLILLSLFLGYAVSAQDVLLTQSWENGGNMPSGWAKTNLTGGDALSFVTSSSWPSGFNAYDGSYMVRFNSFSFSSSVDRLYSTTPISTVGQSNITVNFAWLESVSYPSDFDNVMIQWSTDGSTWNNGGTFNRPGSADAWVLKSDILPVGAENQPTLYIGLLFTSSYGNDCYLDNLTVVGTPTNPPVTFQIGNGTSTSSFPYYTWYEDARTQIIYDASEILAAGGLPGQIQSIALNIAAAANYAMYGFNISMQNYSGSTLSGFVSTGWTNVYSGTETISATGWRTYTLPVPFEWDGSSNLLIQICYDNDDWASNSTVYATSVADKTWGYSNDGQTGCTMTGGAIQAIRPNIQMTILPNAVLPTGIVQGFVTNAYGVPLGGASIYAEGDNGEFETVSAPNGSYIIPDITIGTYTMTAVKAGYNAQVVSGIVISDGVTTYQNFSLTQPSLAVTPNPYTVTLNPNEMFDGAFVLANNGNGPVEWTAEVEYTEPTANPGSGQGTNFSQLTYVNSSFGENSMIPAGNGQAMSSRDFMACPDGSKFSQPPVGSDNGYTSNTSLGYKCYQQFLGATGSFKTLTFWAIFTSAPPATMNFNIEIYGPGPTPTTLLSSLADVPVVPVNTGVPVIGYATYQFTVEVPTTNIPDGWIAVQATTASPTFYWLNTYSGVGTALQQSGSSYTTLASKLAMCLSGGAGGWLTLGQYEGSVNAFTNSSVPAYFNAEGTEAGEIYTANVTFTSNPDVGTIVVPVTMMIAGPALAMPEDLTATLTNPIAGSVALSWTFAPTDAFQHFVVKRDGVVLGTTTASTYTDVLPTYGTYEYSVQAVYDEGASTPAYAELEWPNPSIFVDPTYIYDEVWVNNQAVQTVTISNNGEGTLAFSFPEWIEGDGTRAPLAYCTASGGCDEYIGNVTFGTINNSTGCSQYADYTSMVAELEIGETYPITVSNPVPYSSDIVGVYIDWNHNEVFTDEGEFYTTTSSGSGANFSGNILVPETAIPGTTRMRVRLQYGGTLSSCGSTAYGEVEDYTVDVAMPGFITSVVPAQGTIAAGEQKTITITWDATDFDPGQSYFEDLVVESNDLAHPSVTIQNEMYVYVPAQFEGTVTDIETGEPLNGVLVTANPMGEFSTLTFDDGTAESGWAINPGYDAWLGNYFPVSMIGEINSIDLYILPGYGGDMVSNLTIDIFDINHNLIGTSDPFLVTAAGWYNIPLPAVEFSGAFYAMVHWNMIASPYRYMGWDNNGPYAGSGLGFIAEAGTFSNGLGAGVFVMRANVFGNEVRQNIVLDPTQMNLGIAQNPATNMVKGFGNAGRVHQNTRNLSQSFQAMTDDNGFYSMYVDAGVYNVSFEKVGYQTYIEYDTTALAGVVTPLDAQLREESYPPSFVYAEVNDTDTEVLVTWGDGMGDYEVVYDDGSAENYAAWALPGNMNAVKFTPANYPATVHGGRIYVGDGSFPNNNTGFLGTKFGAMVMDDDGPNGLPGTVLDSIEVTVGNYGWVTFMGLDAEITDGNFYLVMVQGTLSPNCAPIGVDQENPIVYRSYSRNVVAGQGWGLSPFQDLMMRAIVFGSPSAADQVALTSDIHRNPMKQRGLISQSPAMAVAGGIEGQGIYKAAIDVLSGSRSVTGYRVVRYSNFDPEGDPTTGTITNLANNVQGNEYTDTQWAGLAAGWYAYGVAARYPDNYTSDTVVSNIVGHHIDAQVTVNVALTTGGSPAGAVVSLTGLEYPYEVYTATVPESGQVIFPEVWFGHYAFHAAKVGFDDYDMNVNITGDKVIDVILAERKYMPRNLYVDPLTLVATWDEPLAIAVIEDFEGATFPPEGWQALTQNTTGWYATTNGSSSSWTIPPHTKYAVTNDDADNGDGCCDYLITPQMDWTNLPTYRLNFASFYDGAYTQSAYVEISTDAGATWTVIYTLAPAAGAWQNLEVDLAPYSGATGLSNVWLAFHADDNGEWASGWAVDDVQISSGGVPLQGYGVFLDGTLVGNTLLQTFTYTNLNYGQEYLAGVAALYSSGYSELDTYLFRSLYLIPPTNLEGVNPPQTDYVHLTWLAPTVPAEYTFSQPELRTAKPLASVEYSPYMSTVTYKNQEGTRDIWDVLLAFNAQAASMPGIETDGEFIYISNWQGTNFGKYNLDGTWVEDFTVSGAANIRDMAYDGEFFYGGQASTTIYKMNFEDYTLAGTISTSGVSVRHIAYDPQADGGNGGLWAGNWSDLTLVSMTGSTLQTVSGLGFTGMYGSAYDDQSEGGPYLWIFDQGASGTDAVVHQFSIETLTLTGVSHSCSDIPGFNAGIAGGLAASGYVVPNKFILLGNLQQDPNLIFGYELADFSGTGPTVANLLGYNIYRDNANIAYVAKPALEYFDLNLDPGTYSYHITAVYDLTPYGYAGQTGESMIEGPIDVSVVYGYELPFTENWTTGLFETNQWTAGGDNWHIAGQAGNPAPSAEFTYAPVQTDYALSLASYWINGTGFVDGKIFADFDLKLDDNTATGDEQLLVEVFNGAAWVPVATYTAEGDMDWEMKHIDITNQAKNKVFRVRFTAKGANTLDIINWQIDNIHIYRLCEAPTELTATLPQPSTHGDQILLEWVAPTGSGGGPSGWLFWDNGENNDAIGLTGGGTFLVGVRFTPDQLAQYAGTSLTKIRMYPYADGGSIVLKVWTGANASQLVASQPIPSYSGGVWNEFTLNTPIIVTGTTELWFGYEVTHPDGVYVAGCDAGPAVAGFGDMISLDGSVWESMATAYALDYNWNLQGWVESIDGANVPLQPIAQSTFTNTGELVRGFLPQLPTAIAPVETGSRELTGYNIFRDGEFIANTAETSYLDTDPAISILNETFCYKVTAVYEDCESDFSNEACETVISAGNLDLSAIRLYPNPSNNVVNIELTNDVSQLVMYNYLGQVVYEYNVTKDKTVQIDVRNYEAGAYLVKFITRTGESFAKKIAVTR